ncbi:hypothetical protein BJ875DRAFT_490493 [Amylocarpus encephaloides]|uniref:Uncharacterized protein n=1 Tax=Amylocarpus encephaloides TaxID=45428 RepID=A0A9P7Y719_9HELO|nr:hypothetical protein BJ875DRAFT_490493 [Amylocarpus encephaloides]
MEIVSIIIAVVSLIGSLVAAGFTGWISYYMDRAKQRSVAKALIRKYRDPLALAAYDLQSRLWGLVQQGLLGHHDEEDRKDLVYVYTAFLVGQYLSWTYILRRQAQFLNFSTDKTNTQLNSILNTIADEFARGGREGERSFQLWRGQQMAIGETMTMAQEGGQLYCMGFAAFTSKYNSDADFKMWFRSIERDIGYLAEASQRDDATANYRLRRLQHLLVDLVMLLDPDRFAAGPFKEKKVGSAHSCRCEGCRVTVGKPASDPSTKLPGP